MGFTKVHHNQPWWPSGLSRHVSNSCRDTRLGPRFKSCSGHLFGQFYEVELIIVVLLYWPQSHRVLSIQVGEIFSLQL